MEKVSLFLRLFMLGKIPPIQQTTTKIMRTTHRRGNFDVLTNCVQQFHDAVDNRIIDEVSLFN